MDRGVACPRAAFAVGLLVATLAGCGDAERYAGAGSGIASAGTGGSATAGSGAGGDVPVLPIGTGGAGAGGSGGVTGAAGSSAFIDASAPDVLADALGGGGGGGGSGGSGTTGRVDASSSTGGAGAGGGAGTAGGAGTTGSAGTTGAAGVTGGAGVTGACAGKVHALGAADTFIADFEAAGLTGWYEYRDASAGGTLSPLALATPGAAGSGHAGHLAGTGLPAFGAGMGLNLTCWDASRFVGITFWAKGTAGPNDNLALQVAIPATHAVANGGDCVARCFDHPSKDVVLGAEWQQYSVKFADLKQAGFGDPATYTGLVMALNWVSLAGPAVDVDVDQIAFY